VGGGYDARDYRYYRSRLGFGGTVDYRFSDTSSIYLKALYALFHNYGDRWDYNFGTTFTEQGQPDGTGNMSFGSQIRRPVQDLGSLQLGGHHVIKRSLASWDVESSLGRTRDKGYDTASFNPVSSSNLNAIPFVPNNSNPLLATLTAPAGYNVFDPSQYAYAGQNTNNYYNPEVDLGFGGSLATSYTAGGHTGILEVGGRFRNVHKFANQDQIYTVPATTGPALLMTNFLDTFTDPNYYQGSYPFGPTVDYDKVKAFVAANPQVPDPNPRHAGAIGQNFDFVEKVSAGYAMNTINLGRFRVVAGLRFEETSDRDNGTTTPGAPDVAKSGSYLSVLPSASVRYRFSGSNGLRLVYGRGVSRPDFADLVSFASISPGGVRTTSSVGNPNLKAEHADNLDLLYEQTLNHNGLLQAGS
jgi:hypothetical protein